MTTPAATPVAAPDTSSTTEAILDATLAVIGERGLRGATTRLIAQRAGVNEVTLFRKFGTKSKLIEAAIEQKFATVRRSFGGYSGDIEADLIRLAESYVAVLDAVGPAARVFLTEIPYDPELASAARGPQQLFVMVSRMLARYQEEGVLRPEPPQTMVPAFIGPIVVPYIIRFLADAAGMEPLRFEVRQHVSGFLHGRAGSDRGVA